MTYRSELLAPAGGEVFFSSGLPDVQRQLETFAADTPGVTHTVIISLDGLQLAHAGQVGVDLADQLAACTAGLLSIAGQCGLLLGAGDTEYVAVRFGEGHLMCMRIGQTAGLLVAAEPGADLGALGYAMTQFVSGINRVLVSPRNDA